MKRLLYICAALLVAAFASGCAPTPVQNSLDQKVARYHPLPGGGDCGCAAPKMMQSAPERLVFTLEDVLFDYDKANLKPRAWDILQVVANHLHQNSRYNAYVEGHTDSRGAAAYNLRLGQRRAESVRQGLMSLNVAGSRISTKSYGESRPIASNRNEAGRQKNRRVEIILQ
jgi:outer membrane protein OmpA-like peptidoglycan-associated protein